MTHISVVNTFYLLHISATFLLHVSAYLTPSSGRTYELITQNHVLFRSSCLWHSGDVTKYNRHNDV